MKALLCKLGKLFGKKQVTPIRPSIIVPKIYHRGYLPKGVEKENLYRWPFVYLHGVAEAKAYNKDAPDIFLSDTEFEKVNDGVTVCELYMGDSPAMEGEAYIWTMGGISYKNGEYRVETPHREGLVIRADNIEDWKVAERAMKRKQI